MLNRGSKGKFVTTTGAERYSRIERNGRNLELHRYVWEQVHGSIPKGFCIHHINGDKKDNRLENLALVTYAEHNQIHSPDRPIWNAGLTRGTSLKWDEAMKKRMRTKADHYAERCFATVNLWRQGMSAAQIALILDISSRQVYSRLNTFANMELAKAA